jgi:hypothetical protein
MDPAPRIGVGTNEGGDVHLAGTDVELVGEPKNASGELVDSGAVLDGVYAALSRHHQEQRRLRQHVSGTADGADHKLAHAG